MLARLSFKSLFILFAATAIFATACDNSSSEEEEEIEPAGFVIKQGATNLVSQFGGTVTGSITIGVQDTPELIVVFLDEDQNEFVPHVDEHGVEINVTAGASLANITYGTATDATGYPFTITPSATGTVNFTVNLLHEGATEFVSQSVTLTIN